jgi:hypothetical protein
MILIKFTNLTPIIARRWASEFEQAKGKVEPGIFVTKTARMESI